MKPLRDFKFRISDFGLITYLTVCLVGLSGAGVFAGEIYHKDNMNRYAPSGKGIKPVSRASPAGPIMVYRMEEATGSIVFDASGSDVYGTINGTGTIRVVGHDGGSALSFNPSSASNVSMSNIAVTNQISVSAWVRLGTTTVKSKHVVSRHPGWFLSNNIVAGTVRFAVTTATEVSADFDTIANLGVTDWHHCVGVYDGSWVYTYLDGQLKNSGTQSGNMSLTGNTRIGNYWNGGASSAFTWNGEIDDVVVYDRALNANEVWRLYSR